MHDALNREPGGVEVENNMGNKWTASGDASLNNFSHNADNADKLRIERKAAAQPQVNVLGAYMAIGPMNLPALYNSVWNYVAPPRRSRRSNGVEGKRHRD